MDWYYYTFYKLYSWASLNKQNSPFHTAFATLAFLVCLNILAILFILEYFISILSRFPILKDKTIFIIVFFVLFLFQNLILTYNGKYKKKNQIFEKETKWQSIRGTIYTWCYIFFSLFSMLFMAYLNGIKNKTW